MTGFETAIDAIYEAAVAPASWPMALQQIADSFGDVGAVMIFGKEDGGFGVIASPSLQPMTEEYLRDWSHNDVRAIRGRERGYLTNAVALTDRLILTETEMDEEPHYRDFLAKYGLRYFAAISVSPMPKVEAALSIQRARGRHPYRNEDLEQLTRLGRHVERSLSLGIRLLDTEIQREGLAQALEKVGQGILVLGHDGRIHLANACARAMFGNGLSDRAGYLHLGGANGRQLAHLLAMEPGHGCAADEILTLPRQDGPSLVLRLIPLVSKGLESFFVGARWIALLTDIARDGVVEPIILRDMFALTQAEARLASLVGSGIAPAAAAATLGITAETGRTVLKRVFAKMDISRQSELVHLLSRLAVQPC